MTPIQRRDRRARLWPVIVQPSRPSVVDAGRQDLPWRPLAPDPDSCRRRSGGLFAWFRQFDVPPVFLALRGIGWMCVLFLIDAGTNLAGRPPSENRMIGGGFAAVPEQAQRRAGGSLRTLGCAVLWVRFVPSAGPQELEWKAQHVGRWTPLCSACGDRDRRFQRALRAPHGPWRGGTLGLPGTGFAIQLAPRRSAV